jgi:hypothetical protein
MFTEHASIRSQQRAIPKFIEDLLDLYGDHQYQRGKRQMFFFSKRSKRKMNQDLGKPIVKCLSKFFDVVMVKSEVNDVVTVYWHRKPIRTKRGTLRERREFADDIRRQKRVISEESIFNEEMSHENFK